eukprot:TRINITY_DN4274_c0_g1_i2.p1 TRINITY_DN4274_c0_g1~~TRINITY_DN4274_c0_g1_i2.p1  ORF type:complete len:257 (-),score=39.58 TRINITY_DN4274_c0_g1_i2:13-783(-)
MMKKSNGENCETLVWKIHRCEICKGKFPNYIRSNGIIYDLFEIPKQNGSYIEFEVIKRDINSPKIVHIINFNQKQTIQIGRGNDNDFKISDISVSRLHATLIMGEDKQLYIIDNSSKFGTLVKLRQPLMLNYIEEQNKVAIQVGRTFFEFQVNKGINQMFDACCNKSGITSNYYEQQIQNLAEQEEFIQENEDIDLGLINYEDEEDDEPDDNSFNELQSNQGNQGNQDENVDENIGQNLEIPQQQEHLNTDLSDNH